MKVFRALLVCAASSTSSFAASFTSPALSSVLLPRHRRDFRASSTMTWAHKEYARLKEQVPSHILIMQVGSFYELYGHDAELASKSLPLRLSPKGMAGFPLSRKDAWASQLLSHFGSLAIADQVDPGTGAKASREICRVLTPGTLLPDIELAEDSPRTLMAVTCSDLDAAVPMFGVCTYDNIIGKVTVERMALPSLTTELTGRDISELIIPHPGLQMVCKELSIQGLRADAAVPITTKLAPVNCFKSTYVMGAPCAWESSLGPESAQETWLQRIENVLGWSRDGAVCGDGADLDAARRWHEVIMLQHTPSHTSHPSNAFPDRVEERAFSLLMRYLVRNFPPRGPGLTEVAVGSSYPGDGTASDILTSLEQQQLVVLQKRAVPADTARATVAADGGPCRSGLPVENARFSHLSMDADTRDALSLLYDSSLASATGPGSTRRKEEGSLFHVLNQVRTSFGKRELRHRLANPLTNHVDVNRRLDVVEFFYNDIDAKNQLRQFLSAPDPLAAINRLKNTMHARSVDRITDYFARISKFMDKTLHASNVLKIILDVQRERINAGGFEENDRFLAAVAELEGIHRTLQNFIENIPYDFRASFSPEESFPCQGFDADVDALRVACDTTRRQVTAYVDRLPGSPTLDILDGRFVLISKRTRAALDSVSKWDKAYLVKGKTCYSTATLDHLNQAMAACQENLSKAKVACMHRVRESLFQFSGSITAAQQLFAHLDISIALATVALEQDYVRPTVTAGLDFHIVNGRHPILDTQEGEFGHFQANSCELQKGETMMVLTGPNMGGKSTFLRQNALIAIMAQMGSFVPADECRIGAIDKIFTRVGAHDSQLQGESTFMVEMKETANIVNTATERSLVVMDEVGRGTTAKEGLSLAVAITQHLAEVGCRCLSVTHYTQLAQICEGTKNVGVYKFVADETATGSVEFQHRLQPGIAREVYAVHVAAYAGMPAGITKQSTKLLKYLDATKFGEVNVDEVQRTLREDSVV